MPQMSGGRLNVGTLVSLMSWHSGGEATNIRRGGGLQPVFADEVPKTVVSPGQEDTPGGLREGLRLVTTTTTTTTATIITTRTKWEKRKKTKT